MRSILVDAGALVALLDRSDKQHLRARDAFDGIREPLATVWPAVTEAMYLLADHPHATAALCDMIGDGTIQILALEAADAPPMKRLMQKYADTPMDFADAALVRVAEREGLNRIVTFDDDFSIYRLPRKARFTLLP